MENIEQAFRQLSSCESSPQYFRKKSMKLIATARSGDWAWTKGYEISKMSAERSR